jgi:mono/diheme cytochrome c family protein
MDRRARLHNDPGAGVDRVPGDHHAARHGALALALTAAVVAGCGGASGQGGAALFRDARCGSCHVFAATGSRGKVGPSLDKRKLTVAQARAVIKSGGVGMPSYAQRFSAADLDALAKFVVTRSRAK